MTVRKTISLGAVWDDTWSFCRAEAALLAPLALIGFGLPLVVLTLIVPTNVGTDGQLAPGPWMIGLIPFPLFNLFGTLSISALNAWPGSSVGEALRRCLSRLPAALGFIFLALGAFFAVWLVVGIVGGAEMAISGKPGAVSLLLVLIGAVAFCWASLRLLPIWAAITARTDSGWLNARRVFALTRGLAAHLLMLRIVQMVSSFVVMSVVMIPTRAILDLIGRLSGAARLADLIGTLVGGAMASALMTLWTVFVVQLYRQLEKANSGT